MITFPNSKINIGLNVTGKRADGYHNLETVFYPIQLSDALEVTLLKSKSKQKYELYQYGIHIDGADNENLVVKAYQLLDDQFDLPPIRIDLLKEIPSGAGLGGGSADAAFMLKLLNNLFKLNLTIFQMEELASKLGADCAFFIKNEPTFATGIGNVFTPISLSLSGLKLMVVKPDVFISTKEAFAKITPQLPAIPLTELIKKPITEWKDYIYNDFEQSIFPAHPEIKLVKDQLYEAGALFASMSGSGAAVFGIFNNDFQHKNIQVNPKHFIFHGELQ